MLTVFCCQVLIIWWIGSNRTLFLVPDFCCLICLVYSVVLCNVSCAMSGPCFKDDCIVIYIRDGERIGQRRMEGTTGLWRNSLGFSHLCTKSLSDDWISIECVYILMKIPGTFFHLLIFVNDYLINTTPPPPMSREHWFTYFSRSFLFQFCNTSSRCIYAYFVALRNSTNFSTVRTEHHLTPKRSIGAMHDKANAQN